MASEARRSCGFRKVGGLYMVSGALSAPCGRLPLELHVCPVCNAGVKQTRAWTWIKPRQLLANAERCYKQPASDLSDTMAERVCGSCPLSPTNLPEIAGLLWVGEKFYPTADAFMEEARRLGVSRRIPAIPRNFKLGETWVLIAHPNAIESNPRTPEEFEELAERNKQRLKDDLPLVATIARGGIVTMFKPRAIEKIVTDSQMQDAEAMQALREKGITPVAVRDDDKDHQGSAHDKDEDPGEPPQAEMTLAQVEESDQRALNPDAFVEEAEL